MDRVDLAAEISPGITARVASSKDLARALELAGLVGITDEKEELADLLNAPEVGAAVLAGAEHGEDDFRRELAKQFAKGPFSAAQAASLPLVAVTATGEIVGVLVAFPPGNVIQQYVESPAATDPRMALFSGIAGLVKLRALAVDPHWRGRGIGSGLLARFKDIYLACGYFYLYGQFEPTKKRFFRRTRPGNDLETFYRGQGFTILPKHRPLDLWVVFGIGGGIFPDRGERIFYHHQPSD
ncbi:MAG TPA: GNAT family N-acetyltransferase [Kribbella sp.]